MNDLLQQAVAATQGGPIPAATREELAELERDGLIEIGPQEKPGSSKRQFRATEQGVRAATVGTGDANEPTTSDAPQQPQQAPQVLRQEKGFAILSGVQVPESKRRSGPSGKYPFDSLDVGHAFFVPATAERPEPWKSLQSTVTAAQRRHAVEEGTRTDRNGKTVPNLKPTRIFRLVEAEHEGQKGAFVTRTA